MIEDIKHIRYVYHYTSLETLFAILENYRKSKDKKGLVFRASNIFKVNDPTEMERGYDVIKKYLHKYERDNSIPETMRLSEVYHDEENEKSCKDDYLSGIKANTITIGMVPYVLSFSAKRDYLPMWSLYGNKGRGVCLKFDLNNLICPNNTQIGFVAYNKTYYRSFVENIKYLYDLYQSSCKSDEKIISMQKKISELSFICFAMSPYFKYKDYQYEKEFRLVYTKNYGQDFSKITIDSIKTFPKKHEVDPFVEIPIPACSLAEVIMGPCMDENVMRNVIKNEILSCNLKMKVSKSNIPFRLK